MKHYILTRFNLGIYSKDNPYNHVVKNPDEWMEHRKRIFVQYCRPSIQAQSCQGFTWILAFDPETPAKYIRSLDLPDNAIVCMEQPHLWLRKMQPLDDWIITSRFDNDDQYNSDFVQMIHEQFRGVNEIIDIDYTVYEIVTGKHFLSMRTRPNSPFLSLCEPWTGEIVTAMGRPHTVMPDIFPAVKMGIYASQIIHDRNVMNKVP